MPPSVLKLYSSSWDLFSKKFKKVVSKTKFMVVDGSQARQSVDLTLQNLTARMMQETFNANALPKVVCP